MCSWHLSGILLILARSHCRVQGYPTIKAFVPSTRGKGFVAKEYQGERSAAAMKNWALSLIPNKVTSISKLSQLSTLYQQCGGAAGAAAAAWGVCMLLLTDKGTTAPLYKSLAAQYAGKVAFGEAKSSNADLARHFNVTRYGDTAVTVVHKPVLLVAVRCCEDSVSITCSSNSMPGKLIHFVVLLLVGS